MIPLAAIGLAASAGSTIFQGVKGIQQTREAKEMQKNLGARVNYQIPEEAKRALALYQNMAVSRTMPGQQLMQNSIDMQQAKALGGATRAATSSQDLLGVMTNLGEQGMMQQQELGLAAAQNYTQRQQDYAGALGTMAGYQEKVNADKQQDWYERAAAAREMREAGLQNTMGAVQGLGQMGMMAAMGGFGGAEKMGSPSDYSFTDPSSMPTTFGTSGLFANAPRFAGATSSASSSMPRASQGSYQPSFGFGFNRGKNPGMWDDYQPFTTKQTTPPNRYNSGFSNLDMFNPIY